MRWKCHCSQLPFKSLSRKVDSLYLKTNIHHRIASDVGSLPHYISTSTSTNRLLCIILYIKIKQFPFASSSKYHESIRDSSSAKENGGSLEYP